MAKDRLPYKRDTHGDEHNMNLPPGMSCDHCGHFGNCRAMFGVIADDEKCDFSPNRFVASAGATAT